MKVTIIGAGYVGLVTGACLAGAGHEVWCVDKNEGKIKKLLRSQIPIYEPGLESLVTQGIEQAKLFFTINLKEALANSAVCFLAVDTPPQKDGSPDLTNVFAVAEALGKEAASPLLVVTKSTVPVGTTLKVKAIIQQKLKERGLDPQNVAVASNPEFLKEGTSIHDFQFPDRIVVGVENGIQAETLRELYQPFIKNKDSFLVMDIASSELAKYAANAMLASRISFMNEFSSLCEKTGADIDKIRQSLGWDLRIGSHFLYPGLGYGGSCLPKDVLALMQVGKQKDVPLLLMEAVHEVNRRQKQRFLNKIVSHFGSQEKLKGKTIAMWGLSFKPETDDVREAPSLYLIENLLQSGAQIRAFDPVAMENVRPLFGEKVQFLSENYACLEGADCLVIVTEWNTFRNPDFKKMKQLLKNPVIFDGRNLYSPQQMKEMGFDYFSIGR